MRQPLYSFCSRFSIVHPVVAKIKETTGHKRLKNAKGKKLIG